MKNNTILKLSIIINIFLAVFKLIIGITTNAMTLISDGINNLMDLINSFISFVSYKWAKKPADREHPYGHLRFENIGTLIINVIISYSAISLIFESIKIILINENSYFNQIAIFITVISFICKFGLMVIFYIANKKQPNYLLITNMYDARNDCLISIGILIGIFLNNYFSMHLDGYISFCIALIMLFTSLMQCREQINILLGTKNQALISKIEDYILKEKRIISLHDLIIHQYGKNVYATIDVCMDGNYSAYQLHNIIDDIERNIKHDLDINLVIHVDPIKLNDPLTDKVFKLLNNYQEKLHFHDLRVEEFANQINIYLDLEESYEQNINISSLQNYIQTCFSKKIKLIISIDKV